MKSKNFQSKKLSKISISEMPKLNEPKTIDLIKQKGFEFLSSILENLNIFEAFCVRLFEDKTQSKKLAFFISNFLKNSFEKKIFPKELEYLSQIENFVDFYSCFPNHIFFEGVNSKAKF